MRCSGREDTREGEVSGSNPTGRKVSKKFLDSLGAAAGWLTGGVPPQIQKNCYLFVIFLGPNRDF
jgi:hypothetical protein